MGIIISIIQKKVLVYRGTFLEYILDSGFQKRGRGCGDIYIYVVVGVVIKYKGWVLKF